MLEEDNSLIRELKQGNKEALSRVYREHKDRLLTIAVSMVHDRAMAEDILHDVFVSFASGIKRLDIQVSIRKYLIASTVNRIRDKFRKKRPVMVDLENIDLADNQSQAPELVAMSGEQGEILTSALSQIPMEQREVIVLHLNGGLKFKEIAAMQGISTSTIQGRYRYGIEKLRTLLDGVMD